MREGNATKQMHPRDTASSVDDLAAIRTLKTCKIFRAWIDESSELRTLHVLVPPTCSVLYLLSYLTWLVLLTPASFTMRCTFSRASRTSFLTCSGGTHTSALHAFLTHLPRALRANSPALVPHVPRALSVLATHLSRPLRNLVPLVSLMHLIFPGSRVSWLLRFCCFSYLNFFSPDYD